MANIYRNMTSDDALAQVFGFDRFRPGQREVIEHLLANRSALAVFSTGSGKSLCYQLPALLLEGITLVVSPLIALMKDQIDFLVGKGVRAARLDSSLTAEDTRAVWDELRNERLELLYVAPERFASERFVERLRRMKTALMVIDEAHCISEWGHNFRPDYLKLAQLSRNLRIERVLALTATATPAVAEDILRNFNIVREAYINTGFHRPNLTMRAVPCRASERDALLLDRIHNRPSGAAIVYVTLQKTAEQVAGLLNADGVPARAYHAGMEGDERHAVQDWFMASPDGVVAATIAFGMGIDKADIRYIYHYNLPKSLENYMQETGRAGRDGKSSCCDLMICPDDVATMENFSYGDTPTVEAVEGLVTHILSQADAFDIAVSELAAEYDIRTLVVSTLLTYLELEGIIESTGPFYNEYKFKPHRSSVEMLSGLDDDRRTFARRVFAQVKKGRTWFSLDIGSIANLLNERRERVVATLNHFEEQGDLTLKVAKVRLGYRFVQRPPSSDGIAGRIYKRFRESEQRDIARIRQVVELATMSSCTVRPVLDYFGETLESDCGHCDRCLGETIPPMPPSRNATLTAADHTLIEEMAGEQHNALAAPRQLTRFLCGLASPAATRAGLTRDPRFGCLAHLRFSAVLETSQKVLPVAPARQVSR